MILLSANNAQTTLAAGIGSGTTTIILATGTGALFPQPATNEYFTLTLNDVSTGLRYEVCSCTARTGDSLTVVRGEEGTTAQSWGLGDYAYNTETAVSITRARAFAATNTPSLPFTVPTEQQGVVQYCGSTGTITLPNTSSLYDGFLCTIVVSNSGATITVNTNSATVALPSGYVTTSFTLSGLATSTMLQWHGGDATWYQIGGGAGQFLGETMYLTAGTDTYTAPPGTILNEAFVYGAGGSSAGAAATSGVQNSAGGGGGSGAFTKKTLAPNFSGVSVTVGAGGTAGFGNGNAGAPSYFGSVESLGGGGGSTAGPTSSSVPFTAQSGGGGAAGATGDLNVAGNPGGAVFVVNSLGVITPPAAGMFMQGNGAGGIGVANPISSSAKTGVAGQDGAVIVRAYG